MLEYVKKIRRSVNINGARNSVRIEKCSKQFLIRGVGHVRPSVYNEAKIKSNCNLEKNPGIWPCISLPLISVHLEFRSISTSPRSLLTKFFLTGPSYNLCLKSF